MRAVAWDIDGTLIDSEPLHHRALLAASLALGTDLSDLPDQAFRGTHMHEVWDILRPRLRTELTRTEWLHAIDEHYAANLDALIPIVDAVATVRALDEMGVPQACVSNSGRAVVDANLAALGIADIIRFSISFDDVTEGKPSPQPYLLACEKLGLPPGEVVAVEDSRSGALSARRAGLVVVGYTPQDAPLEDVDASISDFMQFAGLARKWWTPGSA
jgi:HAD superfamily hydrolase (TIGR01509 family)